VVEDICCLSVLCCLAYFWMLVRTGALFKVFYCCALLGSPQESLCAQVYKHLVSCVCVHARVLTDALFSAGWHVCLHRNVSDEHVYSASTDLHTRRRAQTCAARVLNCCACPALSSDSFVEAWVCVVFLSCRVCQHACAFSRLGSCVHARGRLLGRGRAGGHILIDETPFASVWAAWHACVLAASGRSVGVDVVTLAFARA
jgi:hypothetical protein